MMENNIREQIVDKLEKYKQIIGEISQTANGVIQIDTKTKLCNVNEIVKGLLERVKNNIFEIAIIGLEKAGKSTFANALIGLDILPTKEERCTYTASCVKYAEKTYAEVEFYTKQEFNEHFESCLKSLEVDLENYEYGKISLNELQRKLRDITLSPEKQNILEDITDMIKSETEINIWLDKPNTIFSEEQMIESEFKNLIQNPDRVDGRYVPKPSFAVKKVTVYSDKLNDMRNCIIYDVPGFDSPTAIHMEQTKEHMNTADAIILIANASKPSLTGPQVNIFRSGVDSDGIPFNEKIFVFANRADESKNLNYNLGVLSDDLNRYSILRRSDNDRLIPGSAYAYLCRKNENFNRAIQQSIDNLRENGISDGIDEIKQKLEQYNNFVRIKVIEKRINCIEKSIQEIAEEIKLSCGNISLTNGSNIEMLKVFTNVQDTFKEKLFAYRSDVRSILIEKPLTNSILDELKEGFKPESLYPTEAEILHLEKEAIQGVTQFESKLRELKRSDVKEKFDNITLRISEDVKRGIEDEIVGKLLESLNVSSNHIYFEEIKILVKEYIDKYFIDFDFKIILKALTLRFSDEVFEILINKPFLMPDRYEYYQNNAENLVSLALYTENVRYTIKSNNPINTNSLPMISSILFHEGMDNLINNNNSNQDNTKYVKLIEDTINCKINNECPVLKSLATSTVDWCTENNIDLNTFITALNNTMPNLKADNYSVNKETEAIKFYLNKTMDQMSNKKPNKAKDNMTLSEKYFEASKLRENTHEWVIEKFNEDICILIDIISGPLVNAIQLEIPFVANITGIIDRIIDDIKDRNTHFIEFFGNVYPKSEYKTFEENEALQQINNDKKIILDSVGNLLQELG